MTDQPRDLRDSPHSVDWAINRMTDVQQLRDLAIKFRQAMLGQHEVIDHILFGGCEPCRRAEEACDGDLACNAYHRWQAQFMDAIRAA